MYPAAFDYERPSTVQDAIELLKSNPEAKLLAGGHSLLPAMKLRLAAPSMIVDLGAISDLKGVSSNGDGLTIGAMTTYDEAMNNSDVATKYPVLHEAVSVVGDVQVRNRGTIGGSAVHSDQAADTTAALLALGAEFVAQGPNGEKTIAADDFFVDLFLTALDPEDVLLKINLPAPAANTSSAYAKFAHPASGYPVVGVAAVVTRGSDGTISDARVVATGSVLKPTRLTAVEDALKGSNGDADAVEAAAAKATDGVNDWAGDHYASTEYRQHLTQVYAKRALNKALGNS